MAGNVGVVWERWRTFGWVFFFLVVSIIFIKNTREDYD